MRRLRTANIFGRLLLKRRRSQSTGFYLLLSVIVLLMQITTCQCFLSSSLLVRKASPASSVYQIVQSNWNKPDVKFGESVSFSESVGETENLSSDASNKINKHVTPLHNSHNQLEVFWAGGDVILCWTKYHENMNGPSTLWISRDYGDVWANNTEFLVQLSPDRATDNNVAVSPAVLDGFFYHPAKNGHFLFTDTKNGYIFTTKNYGAKFYAQKVDFIPDEILFDPHSESNLVAYENNGLKRIWVSTDFGRNWEIVAEHVKNLWWDETVNPAALYLQKEEQISLNKTENLSLILKSNSLFIYPNKTEMVISRVEGFGIVNEFMFATKRKNNDSFDLLIAYKNSDFRMAQFPANLEIKQLSITEVLDDGQIFVCAVDNENLANLYIGSFPIFSNPAENPRFSLSLERILYFQSNVSQRNLWSNNVSEEPFVDLYRVEGLRGVYIATQLKPSAVSSNKITMNDVTTMITYDQGKNWQILSSANATFFVHNYHHLKRLNLPILTEKSAPGVILATGVPMKNATDITPKDYFDVGVYLSTDGAYSWRRVLQGNYFYAFGDHGGIIVAAEMHRISNEILYSIDDGETWEKYEFYEKNVRIEGLMTEPGRNSTIFFIFGLVASESKSSNNSIPETWVIFKLDFRHVFERNCSFPEDYKDWSPYDNSEVGMQCLQGRKETYSRRLSDKKCFNGHGFVGNVSTKRCACTREDFECDFGYIINTNDNNTCVLDGSAAVKNESCYSTAKFYKKSKGYRKTQGNICEEGDWVSKYLPEILACEMKPISQFLLVAKRDSVLRIDLNHLDSVETLPLSRGKQDVIAVDFNVPKNTVFWSDASTKTINKLVLDGKSQTEVLISNNLGTVRGLALNSEANLLYFTNENGNNPTIEVVHLEHPPKNGRRLRKRLIGKNVLEKPRSIAIDLYQQLIFWTDWSAHNPGIGRANLDGDDVRRKRVIENNYVYVKRPHGITICPLDERIYWVDAGLGKLMRSDYFGEDILVLLEQDPRVSLPVAVSSYKRSVYWNDWTTREIYRARDYDYKWNVSVNLAQNYFLNNTLRVTGNLSTIVDIKVFGMGMQKYSHSWDKNAQYLKCNPEKDFCFGNFIHNEIRHCADGFFLKNGTCVCPHGWKPNATTGNCVSFCGKDFFRCRSHPDYCGRPGHRCNGIDECLDGSDEEDCEPQTCHEFKCKFSGRCIQRRFVCDFEFDCGPGDTLDEDYCNFCNCDDTNEFKCKRDGRCIPDSFLCDQEIDCLGATDEENCDFFPNSAYFQCLPGEHKCYNKSICLSPARVCDGVVDCPDNTEEVNCPSAPNNSPAPLGSCSEIDFMFNCHNSKECISVLYKCDGVKDCLDGSDEIGCNSNKTASPPKDQCDQFRCNDGTCLLWDTRCDRIPDCPGSERRWQQDEDDCLGANYRHKIPGGCPRNTTRCGNTMDCVPFEKWCDGETNCHNGQDEKQCGTLKIPRFNVNCNSGGFTCDDNICLPLMKLCDKQVDCFDETDEDERVCSRHNVPIYQVERIFVADTHSSTITLEWRLPRLPEAIKVKLVNILSLCNLESGSCWNVTLGNMSSTMTHRITGLTPNTRYNLTLILELNEKSYSPFIYVNATTLEGRDFHLNSTSREEETPSSNLVSIALIVVTIVVTSGFVAVLIGLTIRRRHDKTSVLKFPSSHYKSSSEKVCIVASNDW